MKNEVSEMPSYEIIIKRNYVEFYKVWDEYKQPLFRYATKYMEKRQKPLKIRVGCEFAIFKVRESYDNDMTDFLTTDYYEDKIDEIVGTPTTAILEDEDRACQGYKHIFIDLNVSTKNLNVYTPETMT